MKYKIAFRYDRGIKELHVFPVSREHEVQYNAHWGREFNSEREALCQIGTFDWDSILVWEAK